MIAHSTRGGLHVSACPSPWGLGRPWEEPQAGAWNHPKMLVPCLDLISAGLSVWWPLEWQVTNPWIKPTLKLMCC